uniref:Cathepsin 12 n=1 Tax=Oncorhynchus mykiss TaxID=8022 RepID=A0A8C7R484_ONCMY
MLFYTHTHTHILYKKPHPNSYCRLVICLHEDTHTLTIINYFIWILNSCCLLISQGYCGSCWAFSTTGAIEGQMFKRTGQLVSLSEQNLVDCSKPYGTYGCSGAWMANAYNYVVQNGLQSTDTYPYTSVVRSVASITDYRFIPSGDEQALADAVATIGPITIAVDADHPSFMFYSSGIYEEPSCNPNNLSHAVLLVGYGSEGGQDYWIIKNSWGTAWGEGGYMRMIRNGSNTCGIASYALYPIL